MSAARTTRTDAGSLVTDAATVARRWDTSLAFPLRNHHQPKPHTSVYPATRELWSSPPPSQPVHLLLLSNPF